MSSPVRQPPDLDRRSLPRTGRTDLLGVRLKPETIELAKQLAVRQRRTIGEVVERAIETYAALSEKPKDEKGFEPSTQLPSLREELARSKGPPEMSLLFEHPDVAKEVVARVLRALVELPAVPQPQTLQRKTAARKDRKGKTYA